MYYIFSEGQVSLVFILDDCFEFTDSMHTITGIDTRLSFAEGPNGASGGSVMFSESSNLIIPNEEENFFSVTIQINVFVPKTQNTPIVKFNPSGLGVGIYQEGLDIRFEVPAAGSDGDSNPLRTTNFALTANTWNPIAVTYDFTTGNRQIFIDGSLVANDSLSALTMVAVSGSVRLGGDDFTGNMACLQIYDTAQNSSWIADIKCPIGM